jgi:serine phosphatase RsbU (regulator of sigma subunit)
MNPEGRLFSGERLLASVRESAAGSPEAMVAGLKHSVQAFVQDNPQTDDITLMGVFFRGGRKQ